MSAGEQCFRSSDCTLDGSSRTTTCGCGLNTNGQAFCTAAPGDDEFLDFKSAFLDLLKINGPCHTSISISARCAKLNSTPELSSFTTAYYLYLYRYLVIGAPSCVINAIAPFAADYDPSAGGSSSSSSDSKSHITIVTISVVIPVILICIVVFIIFFKRLRPRRQEQQGAGPAMRRIEIYHSRVVHQEEGVQVQEFYIVDDLVARTNRKGIPVAGGIGLEDRVPDETYSEIEEARVAQGEDPVKSHDPEEFFSRVR
jgi:hypothetical protein